MIAPNKVVTLQESALSIAPMILEEGPVDMSIGELYARVHRRGVEIERFMLAIDILFLLGRIEVNPKTGVVSYAT